MYHGALFPNQFCVVNIIGSEEKPQQTPKGASEYRLQSQLAPPLERNQLYRHHPRETSAPFGAGAWGAPHPRSLPLPAPPAITGEVSPACLTAEFRSGIPGRGNQSNAAMEREGVDFGPTLNLCGSDSENTFFLHNLNVKS